ncbi:hypothetical protein BKA65DRAFT_471496 [Rhexocercosporidium sp. MPI-PUGE-AT-0058]|nr:hypothetical protein BKA65DRAFT_471496 [Rhexocercosporidium sp. MPI-PUGE-AT-0058]
MESKASLASWLNQLLSAEAYIHTNTTNGLDQHKFTASDITSSASRALNLQRLILQAQLTAEREASAEGNWFISDRSGVDPIVYTQKYVGEKAKSDLLKSPEWLELKKRMLDAVVIFVINQYIGGIVPAECGDVNTTTPYSPMNQGVQMNLPTGEHSRSDLEDALPEELLFILFVIRIDSLFIPCHTEEWTA